MPPTAPTSAMPGRSTQVANAGNPATRASSAFGLTERPSRTSPCPHQRLRVIVAGIPEQPINRRPGQAKRTAVPASPCRGGGRHARPRPRRRVRVRSPMPDTCSPAPRSTAAGVTRSRRASGRSRSRTWAGPRPPRPSLRRRRPAPHPHRRHRAPPTPMIGDGDGAQRPHPRCLAPSVPPRGATAGANLRHRGDDADDADARNRATHERCLTHVASGG